MFGTVQKALHILVRHKKTPEDRPIPTWRGKQTPSLGMKTVIEWKSGKSIINYQLYVNTVSCHEQTYVIPLPMIALFP